MPKADPIPQPIVFRLYPEPQSRLFCRVNVWRDKAEMMAYWERTRGKDSARHHRGAAAIAAGREVYRVFPDGRMRKSGEFCEINCHRVGLDLEIIAHEITHAALAWCNRVRINPATPGNGCDVSGDEERFCYAVGRMVNDLAWGLKRRHVWPRPMCSPEVFDPNMH